jgi:hypothetical protein
MIRRNPSSASLASVILVALACVTVLPTTSFAGESGNDDPGGVVLSRVVIEDGDVKEPGDDDQPTVGPRQRPSHTSATAPHGPRGGCKPEAPSSRHWPSLGEWLRALVERAEQVLR